jgi:hypothetical protein
MLDIAYDALCDMCHRIILVLLDLTILWESLSFTTLGCIRGVQCTLKDQS